MAPMHAINCSHVLDQTIDSQNPNDVSAVMGVQGKPGIDGVDGQFQRGVNQLAD